MPGDTVEFDQSLMPAHQILRDGQSQARAVLTAGDQRIEQGLADFRRNARAKLARLVEGVKKAQEVLS